MVATTLKKAMEGKTWEEIQQLTIIDPACGGGCFLVAIYRFLLEVYQQHKGNELLTLVERKAILVRHIFGVDIDEEAVAAIEEMKANRIFENAFEWRLEFPAVLNEEGDFVGFDVVMGNPPPLIMNELENLP